jgi:hypothetical protein
MSTIRSNKRRGAETQVAVAAYLAGNGWPYACDAGAGRNGCDILNVPGLSIEVKARRDFSPLAWLRQASMSAGIPMCVHRPDGMGVTSVADWPVTLRLHDLVVLLRDGGYGDPR